MPLPNFFLIGAPKCGTTALYHALRQHPDIFMGRVKEPNYFTFNGNCPPVMPGPGGRYWSRTSVWRPADYLRLYAADSFHRVIGDASTFYLLSPDAAQGIASAAPRSKIAAVLRQPAERAYSSYLYMREKGAEHAPTFAQALAEEPSRIRQGYFPCLYHQKNGFYCESLTRYYSRFAPNQIKIYLYEDWNHSPEPLLADLFQFLEVDPAFAPTLRRSNVTRIPRSRRLHYIARHPEWLGAKIPWGRVPPIRRAFSALVSRLDTRYNLAVPPPLDPNIRASLTKGYREDILKLQELIGRDLGHWF
jgi:hypothetical protein